MGLNQEFFMLGPGGEMPDKQEEIEFSQKSSQWLTDNEVFDRSFEDMVK